MSVDPLLDSEFEDQVRIAMAQGAATTRVGDRWEAIERGRVHRRRARRLAPAGPG